MTVLRGEIECQLQGIRGKQPGGGEAGWKSGVDCLESTFEMSSCGGWGRWRKQSLTEGSVRGAAAHKRQL